MFPRPAEIYYPNRKAIKEQRNYNQQICVKEYVAPSWEKLPELAKPMSFSMYMQRIGTTQPPDRSGVRSNVGQYNDLRQLDETTPIVRHGSELIGAVSLSKYQKMHNLALKSNPSIFHKCIGHASSEIDRLITAGYRKTY